MIDAPREIHLAIIRKQFPGITLDDMTLDAGGEHYVYIVDESVVFRFPQIPGRIPLVSERAIDWLTASGAVPFALPARKIRHDPEFDLWFEQVQYIPGVSFTPAVAATFTHDAMWRSRGRWRRS